MTTDRPLTCPTGCDFDGRCALVVELSPFPRDLVDAAIESVADTYTRDGVDIWWRAWIRLHPNERRKRLEKALSYGGMVAT